MFIAKSQWNKIADWKPPCSCDETEGLYNN